MPKAFPLSLDPLFIIQNGFVSENIAVVGPAATPLWAVGVAGVNPAAGRINGTSSVFLRLMLSNDTGGAVTVWLEIGGNVITPIYHLNNEEAGVIDLGAMNVGDQDVDLNASAAAVVGQLIGYQA